LNDIGVLLFAGVSRQHVPFSLGAKNTLVGAYPRNISICKAEGGKNHRTIESLRLEKTSKLIKSSCKPITTMPAKTCLKVPYLHFF